MLPQSAESKRQKGVQEACRAGKHKEGKTQEERVRKGREEAEAAELFALAAACQY